MFCLMFGIYISVSFGLAITPKLLNTFLIVLSGNQY